MGQKKRQGLRVEVNSGTIKKSRNNLNLGYCFSNMERKKRGGNRQIGTFTGGLYRKMK